MDIEHMMKVNALSKELQKHHFATTSEEAFAQADKALGGTFGKAHMPQSPFGSDVLHPQQAAASLTETRPVSASGTSPLQTSELQASHHSPELAAVQEQGAQQQAQAPSVESSQEPNPFLLNKKIEILIKKHTKPFEEQIQSLTSTLSSLSSELAQMKKLLTVQSEKTYDFGSQQKQASSSQQPAAPAPSAPPSAPAEEKQQSHPKQGGFSPSDVSIDKMFYFGNK